VPRTARPVSRTRSDAHELVRQFTRLLKPLELLRALRRDDPEALLAEHHTSTSPIVRNGLGSQLSQASGSRSMGTNGEGATLPYLGITAWRVDASQQSELEGDPDVQAADCIHKRCSCHRSRRGHAGEANRSCGALPGGPAPRVVTIFHGSMSCAQARSVAKSYAHGTFHGPVNGPRSDQYVTVPGGWRCSVIEQAVRPARADAN
jgi:hypothetical protein